MQGFRIHLLLYISVIIACGYGVNSAQWCEEQRDVTVGSELLWPRTPVNSTSFLSCPAGASGNVTRECALIGQVTQWAEPDVTHCINKRFIELAMEAAAVESQSPKMSRTVVFLRKLSNATAEAAASRALYPRDLRHGADWVYKAAANTDRMAGADSGLGAFTQSFSEAASAICDNSTRPAWAHFKQQEAPGLATQLMESMRVMAINLLLRNAQSEQAASAANIQFEMLPFVSNNARYERDVMQAERGEHAHLEDVTSSRVELRGAGEDAVTLSFPAEVLQLADTADKLWGPRFGLYRAEYSSLTDLLQGGHTVTRDNRTLELHSSLLEAEVLGVQEEVFSDLTHPVHITFPHHLPLPGDRNSTLCVFMAGQLSGGMSGEMWDTRGCVAAEVNSTHTVCHCYHLTNFALLIDLYDVEIEEPHETVLSFITFVGGTLSVIGCLLSIIIYVAFRLSSERIKIHQMLAASIILSQLVFFVGFERTSVKPVCQALAVLLHYSLAAMFCWMLVEGIHLYLSLIKVFRRGSHFSKYLVLGWLVPVVSVAISVAVFLDEYAVGDCCWMSTKLLLMGFLPFVCITISVNLVILVMVLRVMMRSLRSRHEGIATAKLGLKATLILLPLLGLTWVFGFLSAGRGGTLVFTYLFTVCNSLQGVFFFIFHCALNSDVQQALSSRFLSSEASASQPTGSPKDTLRGVALRGKPASDESDELRLEKRISGSSCDSSETSRTGLGEEGDLIQLHSQADQLPATPQAPSLRTQQGGYREERGGSEGRKQGRKEGKDKRNRYVKQSFADDRNKREKVSQAEKQSRSDAFRKRHRPPTPTPEKKHVICDTPCALGAQLTQQVALLSAIQRTGAHSPPRSLRAQPAATTPPRVSSFESHTTQASDVTMVSDVTIESIYLDSEGPHDVSVTSDEYGSDCNESDYANYM